MRRAATALTCLAAGSLLSGPAAASDDARACARSKVWPDFESGWVLRSLTSLSVPASEERSVELPLYGDHRYRIYACADGEAVELSVSLAARDGTVLARDHDEAPDTAALEHAPAHTGPHLLVLSHDAEAEVPVALALAYR